MASMMATSMPSANNNNNKNNTSNDDNTAPTLYFQTRETIKIVDVDKRKCIFHLYSSNLYNNEKRLTECPIFVFVHGGGFSAMSFAQVAKLCTENDIPILAFDLYGHGKFEYASNINHHNSESTGKFKRPYLEESNFSIERFTDDLVQLLSLTLTKEKLNIVGCDNEPSSLPRIILIGHSMGGAIATHITRQAPERLNHVVRISGLVVVDVVEGTALAALPSMEQYIQEIPKEFKTLEDGIKYVCKTMLQKISPTSYDTIKASVRSRLKFIHKEKVYRWRTNLVDTMPYWAGWYKGMSRYFLDTGVGNKIKKLLIVAGMDRLDTPLTIAHMQGKFQYKNIPNSGHVIHEENPRIFYDLLIDFCKVQGLFTSNKEALDLKIQNAWTNGGEGTSNKLKK
jgi:protein phosphatase methylesterase 1